MASQKNANKIKNPKFKYLWKHRHVNFIHEKLKTELVSEYYHLIDDILSDKNLHTVNFLIDLFGVDPLNEDGETLLHCAVNSKGPQVASIITLLIDKHKADIDKVAYDSHCKQTYTPLGAAVKNTQVAIVQILLDAGADTTIVDSTGKKAIDYVSSSWKSRKIFHLLKKVEQNKILQDLVHVPSPEELRLVAKLQEGFNLFGIDYQSFMQQELAGRHPDEFVWVEGHNIESTVLFEAFNAAGAKFESVIKKRISFDYFGDAIQSNRDMLQDAEIQFLLKYKDLCPFSSNYLKSCLKRIINSRPVIHEAVYKKADNVVRALLVMGCDPNYFNWDRCTPLQFLATEINTPENPQEVTEKYIVIAKILLDAGADMDEKGGGFYSAFQIAQQSADQRLLQLFEQERAQRQAQSEDSDSESSTKKMKLNK